jgi:crotonobetainyl-CoA:carnitine CoA-transferase CaiB-like acyl-CoA transferase
LLSLLEGLRVLELAGTESGARVGQFLADYGATVTMVEKPGGSSLRELPGWPALGRGKSSRVIDIGDAEGMAALEDLVRTSDVLVHTMRPAAADVLGLTYSRLQRANPRLIVASISGFGRFGPFSELKGYEGIVMAKLGVYQGFERVTRNPGPTFVAVPFASYCASQTALQGILAALLERQRSGLGQQVETNMAQALATLDCWIWFLRMISDRYPDAYQQVPAFDEKGNPNAHQVLTLLVAATSDDRWLQFSQLQPHLFAAFLRALDMTDLLDEAGWSGLPIYESKEKRTAVWERMLDAVARFSLAEWQEKFDHDPDVFAELFRSGAEVLDHPALEEMGWVARTDDPLVGPLSQLGRVVKVVGEDWTPAPSPPVGRDERAIPDPPTVDAPAWKVPPASAGRAAPLDGQTVLDLCVWYAAPYASTLLTDLGARVIHVEPLEGDPIRVAAGFPEAGGLKVMQGKESIAINLSTPEGRDIVHGLARRSSAVLHGFRSGVAEKLGLDFETLRAVNPDLVYVDATGYGTGGSYRGRPSYAPSIAVAAGLTMRNVEQHLGPEPARSLAARKDRATRLSAGTSSPTINADGLSALGTANALLLGLLAAARGQSPHLETTMVSTTSSVNYEALLQYASAEAPLPDPDLLGFQALYRLYQSLDGWIFLAAPREREWDALVLAMEPYLALGDDPRFASRAARVANDSQLTEVLAAAFRTRCGSEWENELTKRDVACVVSSADSTEGMLMSRAVGGASGYVSEVTHPVFGEHPRLAPVIHFSRSETVVRPGCLAGQHTDAILRELGMDPDRIADLRERGVVS